MALPDLPPCKYEHAPDQKVWYDAEQMHAYAKDAERWRFLAKLPSVTLISSEHGWQLLSAFGILGRGETAEEAIDSASRQQT